MDVYIRKQLDFESSQESSSDEEDLNIYTDKSSIDLEDDDIELKVHPLASLNNKQK